MGATHWKKHSEYKWNTKVVLYVTINLHNLVARQEHEVHPYNDFIWECQKNNFVDKRSKDAEF